MTKHPLFIPIEGISRASFYWICITASVLSFVLALLSTFVIPEFLNFLQTNGVDESTFPFDFVFSIRHFIWLACIVESGLWFLWSLSEKKPGLERRILKYFLCFGAASLLLTILTIIRLFSLVFFMPSVF